ncbi:DUF1963 domain-containing protein [Lentzea sp. E54]|uniref:DUF1963 domain-containing protein n=1 Tax=Lentzea xerophila TaxID=3435883 RepID=UPI003DA3E199
MDRYEQFRKAAIDRGIPSDEVDKFAEYLRFSIWLGSAAPGEKVVGQNGGVPRLPVGMEWPGGESPLPFIASIDCAALPRVEKLPLPADGTLLFFLHHEDDHLEPLNDGVQKFARVLYVPADTETAVATLPCEPDAVFYHEEIPFLIPEYPLCAWVEPSLPEWIEDREDREVEWESDIERQRFDELEHLDELCEVADDLGAEHDWMSTLRIGGYCQSIGGQDDPWHQMASAGIRNRPEARDRPRSENIRLVEAEEHRLTREWVSLAQFHTESEVYYGCFLISFDDLAAKRFDKMRSFSMFTE